MIASSMLDWEFLSFSSCFDKAKKNNDDDLIVAWCDSPDNIAEVFPRCGAVHCLKLSWRQHGGHKSSLLLVRPRRFG